MQQIVSKIGGAGSSYKACYVTPDLEGGGGVTPRVNPNPNTEGATGGRGTTVLGQAASAAVGVVGRRGFA